MDADEIRVIAILFRDICAARYSVRVSSFLFGGGLFSLFTLSFTASTKATIKIALNLRVSLSFTYCTLL